MPEYPKSLYRVAISPKTQANSTKISPTLTRLCEEDMTLTWHMETATNQTILQGMGDQHIDVAIRRAETKFQVGLVIDEPKVPYQETITKKGAGHVPPQEADRRRRAVWRSAPARRSPPLKKISSSPGMCSAAQFRKATSPRSKRASRRS